MIALGLLLGAVPAMAQTTRTPASPPPGQPAAGSPPPAEAVASADDLEALVTPVALYPDPLLALILQASTLPLEAVEADRFLTRRESDPSLTPDADWDPSILGLLNYPQLIHGMSENLDWTQSLGNAVLDRLADVQNAISQIRWSSYTSRILVSNAQQDVYADGDYIRITPTQNDTVAIPQYDPVALMAAIEQPPPGSAAAGEAGAVPAVATQTTEAPAETATAPETTAAPEATAPAETAPEAAAPATSGETAAAPPVAPEAVAPPAYAAAPPGYYPAQPPVVAYSEPQSSFWSTAAPFLGGAAIGGMLGYVIGDDDDHDHNNNNNNHNDYHDGNGNNGGRNVNIEDSNIVVGGNGNNRRPGYGNRPGGPAPYGAGSQSDVQRELQQRRNRSSGGQVSPARRSGVVGVPVSPTTRAGTTRVAANRPAGRDVQVPRQLGAPSASAQGTRAAARPATQPAATRLSSARTTSQRAGGAAGAATAAARSGGGMGANVAPKTKVDAASKRGATSRSAAATRAGPKPVAARPQRAPAARQAAPVRSVGGGGFHMQSGASARADASRGKSSRSASRGGGGGGGGKSGRRR
jgi:hypothetical protein